MYGYGVTMDMESVVMVERKAAGLKRIKRMV